MRMKMKMKMKMGIRFVSNENLNVIHDQKYLVKQIKLMGMMHQVDQMILVESLQETQTVSTK
jgi:hypothetical protein